MRYLFLTLLSNPFVSYHTNLRLLELNTCINIIAVSCGIEAKIYCFKCGEFVQHEIFVQEKERVDIVETFPWLGWKEHPVMRSFNALRFMRVLDQGIVWRGMSAEYPQFVPPFHVKAARLSLLRNALFEGNVSLTQSASPETRDFAIKQSRKGQFTN